MPDYLIETEKIGRRNPLEMWHHFTAPPEPPLGADFDVRDRFRRGQLASTIMFWLTVILVFLVAPIGIIGPNHQILIVAVVIQLLIVLCAPLNRRGRVNTVGLILSLALNIGICSSILRSPGGLSPDSIAIFDLLVFAELFFASLLPVNWVILDAAFNITFSILALVYMPRTPLFAQIMHTSFFIILSRPIQLHLIVTAVLWLWVRSATRSLRRADRAEEIAKLQHAIAVNAQHEAEEKELLESSINMIIDTHTRVANGDFQARVPLQQGMPLWQVAGQLNNLLGRMQRLLRAEKEAEQWGKRIQRAMMIEHELERTQKACMYLEHLLSKSEYEKYPLEPSPSGTMLDPVLARLQGKYVQGKSYDFPEGQRPF
ncbi:MAG: hypothetical protein NVS2B12_39860 [Ktedonobacteraceae bacterium]